MIYDPQVEEYHREERAHQDIVRACLTTIVQESFVPQQPVTREYPEPNLEYAQASRLR